MRKQITCALALLACSTFAQADWVGSVNYNNFSDKVLPGQDGDFGAFGFTGGYRFNVAENIRVVPEVRIGFGIGGDSFSDATGTIQSDFEINDYLGVAVRGEYIINEDFYAFAVVSYQNIEVKLDSVRVNGQSVPFDSLTNSNTEVGAGIGGGWQINEKNAVELSYEDIDGSDLVTLGYRFNF